MTWLLCLCPLFSLALGLSIPVLDVPRQGRLRGEVWSTFSEKEFHAFTSVPYAKAPLGKLRFQAPQDAEPWEGIRDASNDTQTTCAQMNFHEVVEGVEDCLYLNVYSTNIHAQEPLPVIFWIHGGGFFAGGGGTKIYGPEFFMEHDVVFVSPNYRLGALGFFTLETEDAPGNIGLRDQIKALEWVQRNIRVFGGNPDDVTVMGESAGSMSALYLMMSPKAKGLFHGIIGLSGSFISSYTHWDKHPRLYGERLANDLGCQRNSSRDIVQCLQELDYLEFPAKTQHFLQYLWTGPNVWMPVVDGHFSSDPVLPKKAIDILKSGDYNKVPIVMGTNSEEGAFNMCGYLKGIIHLDDVEDKWDQLAPLILFHRSLDEITESDIRLARQVKKFYFGEDPISNDKIPEYANMMGDHMFYSGVDQTIKLLAETNDFPVYQYMYSYRGSFTTVDPFVLPEWQFRIKLALKYYLDVDIWNQDLGVSHADELFIMFQPHILPMNALFSDTDRLVSQRLTGLFSNFARFKNPTPKDQETFPAWAPVTTKSHLYYNISDQDMRMEYHQDYRERMDFWKGILNEVNSYRNFISDKAPLLRDELHKLPPSSLNDERNEL
eukprot:maker-scaffold593_size129216-snap-gene-0.28 protein:Tk12028 transcript:maker-scaffold593_size129216-snap-gene-0.28-mRNA-1 annotation:"acetylcholinesterase "